MNPTIQAPDKANKQQAETAFLEINTLVDSINSGEAQLESNYVRLGESLLKIKHQKLWLHAKVRTFGEYLDSVKCRLKGRSQLYELMGVAKILAPSVSEDSLVQMGITKATELKKLVSLTGNPPPPAIVQKAADPNTTVPELRATIFEATNQKPEGMLPMEMGMIYVSPEERAELVRAMSVAERTDPVISREKTPGWAIRKEIYRRWAVNYLATFEAEVQGR